MRAHIGESDGRKSISCGHLLLDLHSRIGYLLHLLQGEVGPAGVDGVAVCALRYPAVLAAFQDVLPFTFEVRQPPLVHSAIPACRDELGAIPAPAQRRYLA